MRLQFKHYFQIFFFQNIVTKKLFFNFLASFDFLTEHHRDYTTISYNILYLYHVQSYALRNLTSLFFRSLQHESSRSA